MTAAPATDDAVRATDGRTAPSLAPGTWRTLQRARRVIARALADSSTVTVDLVAAAEQVIEAKEDHK